MQIDEDSRKPKGLFTAAYELLDSGELNAEEWRRLRSILDWYNEHLLHPPKSFRASRAIFWFKSSARSNIRRMWEMVEIMRAHSRPVTVYKCRRLGNISYEDDLQVAAYPRTATDGSQSSS
jgi:hypothetical protein